MPSVWGNQYAVYHTHVSTSGFQCKIDFFDDQHCPKITLYPYKIIAYVLEKLGIAMRINVIKKDKQDIICINTKDLIKWRYRVKLESCNEDQFDQAKAIDCILTGEGIQGQIFL